MIYFFDQVTRTHRTQGAVGAPIESADARSVELVAGDGEIVNSEVVHVDWYLADGLRVVRMEQNLEIADLSALHKNKMDGRFRRPQHHPTFIRVWMSKRARI